MAVIDSIQVTLCIPPKSSVILTDSPEAALPDTSMISNDLSLSPIVKFPIQVLLSSFSESPTDSVAALSFSTVKVTSAISSVKYIFTYTVSSRLGCKSDKNQLILSKEYLIKAMSDSDVSILTFSIALPISPLV
ncbi:hypothetical protein H8D85_01785 [bacterium]|nr:hypothetical protein [bacterium]